MDPRIRIHTKMSWIRNTGAGSLQHREPVAAAAAVPPHCRPCIKPPRLLLLHPAASVSDDAAAVAVRAAQRQCFSESQQRGDERQRRLRGG